jgi:hypothetical protein
MAHLDEEAREGAWGEVYDKDEDKPTARDFDITSLFNPRHLSNALDRVEGLRRGGIALGALVVVALVFLCFKLAFNTATRVADSRGLAHRGDPLPDDDAAGGPGIPAGRRTTYGAAAGGYLPPALRGPTGPPPPPPLPAPGVAVPDAPVPVFDDPEERLRVAEQVQQARDAYDLARKLDGGPFWQRPKDADDARGAAGTNLATTPRPAGQNGGALATAPTGTAGGGQGYGGAGQDAAETRAQVEALGATVTLTMHPDRYPLLIRGEAKAFAQEMRTYLSTVSYGLTVPDDQGRLHGTASPHLERAGQILSRLEERIKSGTMPLADAERIAGPSVGLPPESEARGTNGG